MEEIIKTILIILIISIPIFYLFLSIIKDMESAQSYKKANRCVGKIRRQIEDYKLNAYGSGMIGMRRRTYRQYEVEFQIEGRTYIDVLQTKKRDLIDGDSVEIHYIKNENTSEPEIITSIYAERIKELLIGVIFGVILAMGIIVLKVNR